MSQVPEKPSLGEPPRRGSWWTVIGCLLAMFLGSVFLLSLPIGRIGVAIIVGAVFLTGLFGFHYITWGRYLSRVLREEADRQERESANR